MPGAEENRGNFSGDSGKSLCINGSCGGTSFLGLSQASVSPQRQSIPVRIIDANVGRCFGNDFDFSV